MNGAYFLTSTLLKLINSLNTQNVLFITLISMLHLQESKVERNTSSMCFL